MILSEILKRAYNKTINQCSDEEIYAALVDETNRLAFAKKTKSSKKKVYYICAEFLIGKLLSNNLINLGIYRQIKEELEINGRDICTIEELESEPALGNGGLGRLAACFLDSMATMGLCGDGIGLCYHFGLFRQVFKDNCQTAQPDVWLDEKTWLCKTDKSYKISFKNHTVTSRMYDIAITGYDGTTNNLHLFDVQSVDESIVEDGIEFDKTDIEKNLTLFLYPDDSDENGRLLRIYQQYFMVANAAAFILDECIEKGCKLYDLYDYAAIQINDTHPTMIIPELIRLLCQKGIEMDKAVEIVSKCCAYTNHTILAEALEKWPVDYIKRVVPQLLPIIEVLDDKVRRRFDDKRVYIIDENENICMAHIDIHCCFSVNGVAQLHTQILKNEELAHFYKIYPEKFNNKTNGITFRRWLLHSNEELSDFITSLIGDKWKKNANELERLNAFENDREVLERLIEIKHSKKIELKKWLQQKQQICIDENSIFDIQIKRLHEYKRQQLNALYVIYRYLEIKSGAIPSTPITVIFGAKAATAYKTAQDIIHLILCLQKLIADDETVNRYMNVVMVENYNVTAAQKLIGACDISQQISLASKEASGTGNMKFMLNGAVTLGTMDGANVEIYNLVGDDNIYIFGDSSDEVANRYKQGSYNPKGYYENDMRIKNAVDFIISDKMKNIGNENLLCRLRDELLNKDWFMTFADFDEYVSARERAYADFENRLEWAKKMLKNIAMAGAFSSDRSIEQYNADIWKL